MRPTFLTYNKPLLCAMIQASTPEDAICQIVNASYDGAEAFGIQLEVLKREYRDLETLKKIFSYCENKPIYLTSYRYSNSDGYTDDQCAELLLLGLSAGGTLCDIMGDMFNKDKYELTYDEEAVEKQKALAKKIHEMGGEVLISSHLGTFVPEEEVVKIALAQQERGADVVKIVNHAQTHEQLMEDIRICDRLNSELDTKFLYLANGPHCKLLRQMGAALGCCMYLCVQHYLPISSKEQPKLSATKQLRDAMFN
ncbi:MAG: type I 3-dehydroquinate dehydratase [Acutalibacteraceae bacterium]|nr:type I 3-dehydroquinate dehydratase [Acutalibacteraceae bacterium]